MRPLIALSVVLVALSLVSCASPLRAPEPVRVERPAGFFEREAVAADHPLASEVGASILAAGGNAVDAAVATSLALSVVRPMSCGIGGGGFMLIVMPDDPQHGRVVTAFDYRERAPGAVAEDFFEGDSPDSSRHSGKAVAIPGTVAGLFAAHEALGVLDWSRVVAPAIRLARDGWVADTHTIKESRALASFLATRDDADPFMVERFAWLHDGAIVSNVEQARALELISSLGPDGFYKGEVAQAIIDSVRARGGVMTLDDLDGYRPKRVSPIAQERFGKLFVAMPLPSSGGVTMLQALGILEARADLWAGAGSPSDPSYAHVLIESMKHAFSDRAALLGDPEYHSIPLAEMLDDETIDARARRVHPRRTFGPEYYAMVGGHIEDGGTSHVSVVDRWGNAVAMTETINLSFGAKFTASGFGFALNNEMDDFLATRGSVNAFGLVQSERNLPMAGKRPLSSMSPTIVLDAETGRVEAVAGASGGPRIITGTMQSLLNALLFGMGAQEAVDHPRVHHQWTPDAVFYESFAPLKSATRGELGDLGHAFREREDIGSVQLIRRVEGGYEVASDPRKGGLPAGR